MYVSTLTISSKGQIILPKKIREMLRSNVVSLEVNEHNQLLIAPVHDLGGSLSAYQKQSDLSFEEIRNQAWNDSLSIYNNKLEIMLKYPNI
jgi:bifunctional DNA-binding transcriptional regulator/antitoxin component of YhaV-PrlF toxin-antitoxin module